MVPSGGRSAGQSGVVSGVRRCVRRLSGVCPEYVRGMSDVCPPDGESRTQRRTVRRTEDVAIIARDVITYSDDVVTEVKQICLTILLPGKNEKDKKLKHISCSQEIP